MNINIHKLLLIIGMIIVLNACNNSSAKTSIEVFENIVDQGFSYNFFYKSYILTFGKKDISICIFNSKPNFIADNVITQYYAMLEKVLKYSYRKSYVKNIVKCPVSTDLYINIHEDIDISILPKQWAYILQRNNFSPQSIHPNSLGFFTFKRERNKVVGFVAVNQLSKYVHDEKLQYVAKAIIIQELFQVTTLGRDIENKSKISSVLEESQKHVEHFYSDYSLHKFIEYFSNNPKGLCGLDVWYLIVLGEMNKNHIYKNSFEKKLFISSFKKNISRVKQLARKIEANQVYHDLFDPRCSGLNTGIETKIGIIN